MEYKAYSDEFIKLKSLPETGMGYQVIDAKRSGSTTPQRFIVYNSEIIVPFNDVSSTKTKLFSESFRNIVNRASHLGLITGSITLVTKRQILEQRSVSFSKVVNAQRSADNSKGAKESQKVTANGSEVFVRLSAYEEDVRIDKINKKLTDGSYATTYEDYQKCVTKDDPVDRYALPNDEVIKYAFYIQPKSSDTLQRGVVQPANGHEGGGVEAYFENGTSNGTYLEMRDYEK